MRALFCLLLAFTGSALAQDIDAIRGYLSSLERLGFAGSVLIAQGDDILLHKGYGLADRATGRRWDERTVSTVGSITKQFTGAAILTLQEDGLLRVEDPITKYFDDVPADKRGITLHQLLTHSSGIVDLRDIGDFDPIGREEFVRRAMEQELAFESGKGYEYSNAGYSLLGAILEQLSGKSYEHYLRDRFFEPLGMPDTGYQLPNWSRDRLAHGVLNGEDWGVVVEHPMAEDGPYWVLRANGGIHTTLRDLWRWCRALQKGKVLSEASMEQYWHPHVDEGGGESYYGYGWVVVDYAGQRVITHNGGNGIHFADVAIVPATDMIVALQTNVVSEFALANQMLMQMGQQLFFGGELPRVPAFEISGDENLAAYAGRYRLPGGGLIAVSHSGEQLDVEALDAAAFSELLSLRPVDADRAQRFVKRMDGIVGAYVDGDFGPLAEAYGGRVEAQALSTRGAEQRAEWEAEHGAFQGYRILGTAFRDERDVTVVRFEFADGHVDRAYVFDWEAENDLLGVSARGLDVILHVYPDRDGNFLSWDSRSGAARPLRFEGDTLRFLDRDVVAERETSG